LTCGILGVPLAAPSLGAKKPRRIKAEAAINKT
jgi:hypothetical protein